MRAMTKPAVYMNVSSKTMYRRLAGRLLGCTVAMVIGLTTVPSRGDAPAGRFMVGAAGAGTVTDTKTGRIWQQASVATTYSWGDVQTYCSANTATLPGTGWRWPTIKELQSIVDDRSAAVAIDTTAFPSTPPGIFWSSTPYKDSPTLAWFVDFSSGNTGVGGVSDVHYARCVR